MKIKPIHFKYFKKEFLYWADYFNLNDTRIEFKIPMDGELEASGAAGVDWEYEDSYVTVYLNSEQDFTTKTAYADLANSAFHECVEVLLYRLHDMAIARNFDQKEWLAETHSIIHLLWNRIGKKKYKIT